MSEARERDGETEGGREGGKRIQNDRGGHVKLSESPTGEAVADMIIDL